MTNIQHYTKDDLKVATDQPDFRFVGHRITTWRGYIPEDGVIDAIKVAVENLGEGIIAFVCDLPESQWKTYTDRQRKAVRAWAADTYPHLKVTGHTQTLPFRGIGSDCLVFYVQAVEK